MKRKVVLKVDMKDQKSHDKALKLAAKLPGMESAAIQGDDKSLLEVTGEEIDPVQPARLLRKGVGHVDIVSVSPDGKRVHQDEHTSWLFSHSEEEDMVEDDEVDARDDFISKSKQQLDLQRIDSILRYENDQPEERQVHQHEHTSCSNPLPLPDIHKPELISIGRKVVFKLNMKDQKSRDKALKIVAELRGMESVALQGADKNILEVTGNEIDAVQLVRLLSTTVGHVDILSVSPVVDKEKQVHQREHTSCKDDQPEEKQVHQEGEETPKHVRASSVSKRNLSPYRSQEPVSSTTVSAFERIPDVGDTHLQDQRQEQYYLFIPPPQLQQKQPPADNDSLKLCRPDLDSDKEMSAPVIEGNDQVTGRIISTTIGGKNGEPKQTVSFMAERVLSTGSFGIVFQAKWLETGETVAIKKVLQDRRYKSRELKLMRLMDHPNVVSLKHCFYSATIKDELFLHLVMEYVPETVYRVLKNYNSMNQRMPLIYVKLYTYQTFRGLAYIHAVPGVCHRDVEPRNLLVDPLTHQVKLCDFGSAKVLVKGEANVSYICSRFYRAPELIFGATEYTTSVDIWSAGCVLAELLLGQPLFPGKDAAGQLVEIIKILGTPTQEEIRCMNPKYTDFEFPQVKAHQWHKVFHKRIPPEAIDLASRLLQYSPSLRCTALEALAHPFFDELREPNACLPNGRPLPSLFNFRKELAGASPELINRLIPEHVKRQIGHGFPHLVGDI